MIKFTYTPEQLTKINVAMCELLGWTDIEWNDHDNAGPGFWSGGVPMLDHGHWGGGDRHRRVLPNLVGSLDEVWKAEEVLFYSPTALESESRRAGADYEDYLYELDGPAAHATALERCECILMTLNPNKLTDIRRGVELHKLPR